jgi:dolichol-phosphate mannosyltransferase
MSNSGHTLAVIIPCYRVAAHIAEVIKAMPPLVAHIIAVDDRCPENSGNLAEATGDPRLTVIRHSENQGVGGAMISGYRKALELGAEIVVKVDGDGQMDLGELPRLIAPIIAGRADYAKGNRFRDFKALKTMPRVRLFGNSMLSFLIKAASGYWSMMDPTNGYTAIHRKALSRLDLDSLDKRYFFESGMLIRLNLIGAVVEDVAIPARYGDEASSLSISRTLVDFPPRIARGFFRRILLKYFLHDFNMGSLYLVFGLPMLLFGMLFGAIEWVDGLLTGIPRPIGTVMVAVLPCILGVQLLLQAVGFDMAAEPKRPLQGEESD